MPDQLCLAVLLRQASAGAAASCVSAQARAGMQPCICIFFACQEPCSKQGVSALKS